MLRHNQHFRAYMSIQQFGKHPKSFKTAHLSWILVSLLKFNYNGINKQKFIRAAGLTTKHFSRDTKELRELDFMKIIDGEIWINPRLCWAGSDRIREYRIRCYDAGVIDSEDQQPSDDENWVDYLDNRIASYGDE